VTVVDTDLSFTVDEARKSRINDDLLQREIRTIDLNNVLYYTAALKKEK
jgi:hypothetical protein